MNIKQKKIISIINAVVSLIAMIFYKYYPNKTDFNLLIRDIFSTVIGMYLMIVAIIILLLLKLNKKIDRSFTSIITIIMMSVIFLASLSMLIII
ncbi:hypothetical protein [Clostridium sp.]|jgi:hypothetical protein|uniref:hypothetical protein n=1 Tax=Clostridium sp. TaxID=1506 RepID=UPI003EEFE383